jgi:hypothetical protein
MLDRRIYTERGVTVDTTTAPGDQDIAILHENILDFRRIGLKTDGNTLTLGKSDHRVFDDAYVIDVVFFIRGFDRDTIVRAAEKTGFDRHVFGSHGIDAVAAVAEADHLHVSIGHIPAVHQGVLPAPTVAHRHTLEYHVRCIFQKNEPLFITTKQHTSTDYLLRIIFLVCSSV